MLQGGIQKTADVPGATAGAVRMTIAEELENATPRRICQQSKEEVPILGRVTFRW